MRVRRLRKEPAHLEITAFINLIVVLVPFLLSTAVFSRLAVIDLTLPAQSSGVEQIKTRFPDQLDATVLAEPNTPYDTLVQVMDAVRAGHVTQGKQVVRAELFPNIAIGDAPVRTR